MATAELPSEATRDRLLVDDMEKYFWQLVAAG
jgi:hypothetical protein